MTSPTDDLRTLTKTRYSLDPNAETVFRWTGNVYANAPGQRPQHLFKFEGFNIARAAPIEGGLQALAREAAFYMDPKSGDILEAWHNPLNDADVDVIHVWNDPVNQQFQLNGPRGPFAIPIADIGNDMLAMYLDILLFYPSPLSRAQFPDQSQHDMYQGMELFQFFFSRRDLEDDALLSVPCANSWTRIGPWLPFMRMGDRPGHVVYQCRGSKLMGGYAELPATIRDYVERHQPQFAHAPAEWSQPNETSWTYFKKLRA